MNQAIVNFLPSQLMALLKRKDKTSSASQIAGDLSEAKINKQYTIKEVISDDKEMNNFLFTLGCFKGESVTLISVLSETYVIAIKDARYSIDLDLAKSVILI